MMGTEPVFDGRSLDPRLDPNYSGGNRFQVTGRSEQRSAVSSPAVPFELRDFRDGDAQILALSGELDIATRDELELAIEEAEETSAKTIVLDLRRLEFIDSSGIHVIVAADQRIGERLVVLRGPQRVRRVFDLCGLTARIASADSSPRDVAGGDFDARFPRR
jgi:anti-sigma B factor antagonist